MKSLRFLVAALSLLPLALGSARADDDVVVNAGKDGFSLQSRGGAFAIRFRGGVQADSRWFLQDRTKLNVDTFLGRRVRPIIEGTVHERYDFRVMFDLVDGRSTLLDAYLDVRPSDAVKVRFGKFKPPVSLERLQSFPDIRFVERAYPTNLAPNRDYGFMVHGEPLKGAVSYGVGVFNGAPDGGNIDVDASDAKDVTGRVFFQPWKNNASSKLNGIGFGVAGTQGDQAGALPSYKSTGQATVFSFVSGATADDERTRVYPQLYAYSGPLGVIGEYVQGKQVAKKDGKKTHFKTIGAQVVATYLLTGEKASYKAITPNSPFNFYGGKGAIELAARFQTFDVEASVFQGGVADPTKSVRRADSWSGGVNWYLNKNARFAVNYELTEFRRGAAKSHNRPTERVVETRYQLSW